MTWLDDALASIAASGEAGSVPFGMSRPAASPFPDIPAPADEAASAAAAREAAGARLARSNQRRIDPFGVPDANSAGIQLAMDNAPAGTGVPGLLGAPPITDAERAMMPNATGALQADPPDGSPFGGVPNLSQIGSIAMPPSMAAAKEMTAPPPPAPPPGAPMAPQPPVPGLVPPGAAPGVPAIPGAPVMAQGGDTPAAAPTDASARRRGVPPAQAAAALDQAAAEPAFMDRMRAGGGALADALRESSPHLIALGAGLQGEGWNTAASLAAARNKRAEDLALQAQQGTATARLLASKGASPQEIAAAVAGGPDTVKALLGQYLSKDKFAVTQTGEVEDAYGGKRKVFKILNSTDGTFKDVPAESAAEAKQIASGEAPELNDSQKNRVRAIIEGREPYPALSRATDAAKIRAAVHAEDPNFDAVNYNSRSQTRKNFTSGKAAGNVTAFNTAIGHLGTLYDSIDGLGNRSSPWYNRVTQPISENLDTKYAANLKKFEAARTAVADELTRAFRGSGGNVHDIIQWEKTINTADSPEALKAAVQQAAELLNSRIVSLGDEYNRGMGTTKNPMELLNPKAASAFQHLLEGGRKAAAPAAAGQVKPGNYVYKNGVLVPE